MSPTSNRYFSASSATATATATGADSAHNNPSKRPATPVQDWPGAVKPRNLSDIKAGGLGTFFIGQIMDEVIFKTSKVDWVNHLILTKKF